jgi:hypothetical protein
MEKVRILMIYLSILYQGQYITQVAMGGPFTYRSHQSIALSSNNFKKLGDAINTQVIARQIF